MRHLLETARQVNIDESGHAAAGVPALIAAIAAVVLAIGAASNSDVTTIISGIVLAVGIFGAGIARHRLIDYEVYDRLEKLEK